MCPPSIFTIFETRSEQTKRHEIHINHNKFGTIDVKLPVDSKEPLAILFHNISSTSFDMPFFHLAT